MVGRESFYSPMIRSLFIFLHFFLLGMVLITASCTSHEPPFIVSSGTLSIRSNPLNLFVTSTYNRKGFDLGHT